MHDERFQIPSMTTHAAQAADWSCCVLKHCVHCVQTSISVRAINTSYIYIISTRSYLLVTEVSVHIDIGSGLLIGSG